MEITKIVLTGGPGAGKTTAQSWIQNDLSKLGYKVLFVPETASELITGGVAPGPVALTSNTRNARWPCSLRKKNCLCRPPEA